MLTLALKGLLARKRRLFSTALAVTLGVAFLAGTLVLTDTIQQTFDDLFSDVYRDTDAVVRAKAAFEGPFNTGDQRGRIDASLIETVSRVEGVAKAEGEVLGYARLVAKDGKAMGNPEFGAPTYGANWSDTDELNPFTIVHGRPPQAGDEVVIDRKSATDGKLTVGDTTTVLVRGPPQKVRITGIARFGSADSPGGASFVMFVPDVAQRLVAEAGRFDSIALLSAGGLSQEGLVRRVQAVLPPGTEALTGRAITEENQSQIRKAFSYFSTFILVFAAVGLLVGGFIIFNTFSITVAQRTRENGLLRALGASRRQLLASVMIEAFAIGLFASLIGLVAGVFVAGGLRQMLAGFGIETPSAKLVFEARTALVAMAAGTLLTLVAAISPARHAGTVSPVAAMQAELTGSGGYGSKQRVIVGVAILAGGIGALLFGLFGSPANALQIVGLGVVLTFFGVSTLGRTISLPMSRVLGAPLPRIRGTAGTLARENAMRNPHRTASSASALMIGVGLVGFITILAASTKTSINASIDRAFTGDFVVNSGSGFTGGIDPGMARELNGLPEIETATGVSLGSARIDGKVKILTGLDPETAFDLIDVKPRQGSSADLGIDGIAVHEKEAGDREIRLGDRVPVVFKDSGEKQMRVAMIYGEDQPIGRYFIGVDAWDANFADRFDLQVFVKAAPGVTTGAARAAVERVAARYAGTDVFDQTGFKNEQSKQVNTLLGLVYALLALAIVIAVLGIGNTLALSIFERTRELGLLRAVGMTRSQLRSTIRLESVIIALQGTALGLAIGVFFGWALVTALKDQGIERFDLPVGSMVMVVVLAALAGVLAAIPPGRRAAKLDVLKAIATE